MNIYYLLKNIKLIKVFLVTCIFILNSCEENNNTYYSNGNVKTKMIYTDKKEKKYLLYEYFENGILKSVSEFKNGIMYGKSEKYYPNSKVKSITMWRNDTINGKAVYYYEEGGIRGITNWKDGLQDGEDKMYYENKVLKVLSYYKKGKLDSISYIYDNKGKIEQLQYFKMDTLIYANHYVNGLRRFGGPVPLFIKEKDSVYLGEEYRGKIKFNYKLNGKVNTSIQNKEELASFELFELLDTGNNTFLFSCKPKKRGLNVVNFYFSHKTINYDTLSVDGIVLKHQFYVK